MTTSDECMYSQNIFSLKVRDKHHDDNLMKLGVSYLSIRKFIYYLYQNDKRKYMLSLFQQYLRTIISEVYQQYLSQKPSSLRAASEQPPSSLRAASEQPPSSLRAAANKLHTSKPIKRIFAFCEFDYCKFH